MSPRLTELTDRRREIAERIVRRVAELNGEPEPTLAELVAGARASQHGAWQTLVDRCLPLVTGIVDSYRLSKQDAEDVVSTVWLRAVEHLDTLDEPQSFPDWLATTTRREAERVIGASTLIDPESPVRDLPDDGSTPDVTRHEQAHALREAMLELPPRERELLVLLLADPPFTYTEISRRLEIPIGSIGPMRARALHRLRQTEAFRRSRVVG